MVPDSWASILDTEELGGALKMNTSIVPMVGVMISKINEWVIKVPEDSLSFFLQQTNNWAILNSFPTVEKSQYY